MCMSPTYSTGKSFLCNWEKVLLLKEGKCRQCKLYTAEERIKTYMLIALVLVTSRQVHYM